MATPSLGKVLLLPIPVPVPCREEATRPRPQRGGVGCFASPPLPQRGWGCFFPFPLPHRGWGWVASSPQGTGMGIGEGMAGMQAEKSHFAFAPLPVPLSGLGGRVLAKGQKQSERNSIQFTIFQKGLQKLSFYYSCKIMHKKNFFSKILYESSFFCKKNLYKMSFNSSKRYSDGYLYKS